MDIEFFVAQTDEEYERLQEFQQTIEERQDPLGFPTVYGLDEEGRVRCFISTSTDTGAVIANSGVVDPEMKPRYALGKALWDAYDTALKNFGITQYLFAVVKTNQRMFEACCSQGYVPYGQDETSYWYKRDI